MAHSDPPRTISEEVAVLKRQMQDLMGNGQPGRVAKLESAQFSMKLWIIGGVILSGLSSALGTHAMDILKALVK